MRVARFLDRINERIGLSVSYAIFIIAALMLLAVVTRRFLNVSNLWSYETTQFFFGAYFILAGGYALGRRMHVNMDILYNRLSPRGKAIIDLVTSVFFFLFLFFLVWTTWKLGLSSFKMREVSDSPWAPPLYPIKLVIPIGAFLVLISGISKFINDVYTAIKGRPYEH